MIEHETAPLFRPNARHCALTHHGAERQQRKLRHFEALQAERNGDDGDAAGDAREHIGDRHGNSREDQPEDVGHQRREAAAIFDGFAEGRKSEACHLERLAAQRNADDGDAEKTADEQPPQRGPNAAEQNPNDIAESFHDTTFRNPPEAIATGSQAPRCMAASIIHMQKERTSPFAIAAKFFVNGGRLAE